MYKTGKEIAQEIRQGLKEEYGYNRNDVSVRCGRGGLETAINIVIKNEEVDYEAVEQYSMSFQDINYDEITGEILAVGNTYIFVRYDHKIQP